MKNKLTIRDIAYSSLFAALTAVLGYITIPLPFSPVPITAQTLAVMLAGCVLTPVQAGFSMLTFLLMGAVGIPVFSGGRAGLSVIVGPSGGYLIGFVIGAIVISLIVRRSKDIKVLLIGSMIGGIIVVHLLGFPWLGYVLGMDIVKAAKVGTIPYIPGDIFKAIVAVIIGSKINKQMTNYGK